jgi:hypothetical protein
MISHANLSARRGVPRVAHGGGAAGVSIVRGAIHIHLRYKFVVIAQKCSGCIGHVISSSIVAADESTHRVINVDKWVLKTDLLAIEAPEELLRVTMK